MSTTNAGSDTVLRKRSLDLAGLVDLELVAFLDVRVVLEHDPALETGADLAHVVLDAPERGHGAVVDDRAVADQAHLRAARDAPVGDVGAGDRADARGAEDRPHLD